MVRKTMKFMLLRAEARPFMDLEFQTQVMGRLKLARMYEGGKLSRKRYIECLIQLNNIVALKAIKAIQTRKAG